MLKHIRRTIRVFWMPLNERVAQARYFAASDSMADYLWNYLPACTDAAGRAAVLEQMVELETEAADATAIFDNDRTDDDGFTPEQWERSSAALYELVAAAERCTDPYRDIRINNVQARNMWRDSPEVELALDKFMDASEDVYRAAAVKELCTAVMDIVGGQAAESLASLSVAYLMAAGYDSTRAWNAMSLL